MNDKRFNELLSKLTNHIDRVDLSVSPTLGSGDNKAVISDPLFLTVDTDIERLSEKDLYLAHTLMHTFYARGGNKDFNKNEIKEFHNKIKTKIKHIKFDKLDEK